MNEKDFEELVESIKQAGKINRGLLKPGRIFEYDFRQGRQGAIDPTPPGKTRVTIRLDNDVLDRFRDQVEADGGGNYQMLINQALRDHMAQRCEPLETMFRRVLREELAAYD